MSPEIAQIIVAALALVGTVAAAWLAQSARSAARGARHQAVRTAENVEPISNGFAGEVREKLGEILVMATDARNEATKARGLIDEHLQAHANAHVYRLEDVRRQAREAGGRL